jgi:hypothetical protein
VSLKNCERLLLCVAFVQVAHSTTVNVRDFGARGNGAADDTYAIQAAINSLGAAGGIVFVPAGTYLLNSYSPSAHGWFFYNLRIGSNITLQGEPGTTLVQGPGGRSGIIRGAPEVRNTVLVIGSPNYVNNTFQDPAYNGGLLPLRPASAGSSSVTLTYPSYAQRFAPGDFVYVLASPYGDPVLAESSQVAAVDYVSGTVTLQYTLARSFSSPSIAKVTGLATVNATVANIALVGAETLSANGAFNITVNDCQFISDTSIGGGNTYGLNLNTMRNFRFARNVFYSIGPSQLSYELPQRNSQNGTFDGNTFFARSVGFGEYAAHWTLANNHFWLYPGPGVSAGLGLGGLDVTFINNDVHGGAAYIPLIADFVGPDSYAAYVGSIRLLSNTIICQADNDNCIKLRSTNPTVADSRISTTGSAVGIKVEGPLPQAASIQRNNLSIQSGIGIISNSPGPDGSVFLNNTISGYGPIGIHVASPQYPSAGQNTISGNTITGFRYPISIDSAMHPGSVIQP